MRRVFAKVGRTRPRRRFGVVLALVALLAQLALPGAAALARTDDPLGFVPICTAAVPGHDALPASSHHHKALHAACPLCQAPSVAGGLLPPPAAPEIAGPQHVTQVAWRSQAAMSTPGAVASLRARGPPGAA